MFCEVCSAILYLDTTTAKIPYLLQQYSKKLAENKK